MKKYTFITTISLCISLFFTSCLKSDVKNFSDIPGYKSFELAPSDDPSKGVLDRQHNVTYLPTDTTTLQIPIYLSTPNTGTFSQDVTVHLSVDTATINAYNSANSTTYSYVPDSGFTTPSGNNVKGFTVTFPAGQKTAFLNIKVNASKIDPSQQFMFAYIIDSVPSGSSISQTRASAQWFVAIKNIYDGTYHSKGYFYHPSSPRAIDRDKSLQTINGNTVEMELGDLGGSNYYAYLTINTDNSVTIVAAPGAYGAPYYSFPTGLPTTNPGYTAKWPGSAQCNNTYDPTTKTFYLRYGYKGGSGYRISEEIVTHK